MISTTVPMRLAISSHVVLPSFPHHFYSCLVIDFNRATLKRSFSWTNLRERAFKSTWRQTQLRSSSSYHKGAAHTRRLFFFFIILFLFFFHYWKVDCRLLSLRILSSFCTCSYPKLSALVFPPPSSLAVGKILPSYCHRFLFKAILNVFNQQQTYFLVPRSFFLQL